MAQIKFGTDGWRAVIAEDFTFANVERVAQATADYWQGHPVQGATKKVVVGYDRRFFSDAFARRVAEVFAGNEFQVLLTPEPSPTPSVSFAVKAEAAIGGVMITASHNPPIFNGFKLKSHYGGSADPSVCQAVEALVGRQPGQSGRVLARRHKFRGDPGSRRAPGPLCGSQETGGFQADRQIETAFRSRSVVRRWGRVLRSVAGGHDLPGDYTQWRP